MKLKKNLLPIKWNCRPGRKIGNVKSIVFHGWASKSPNPTNEGIRKWWRDKSTYGSAHISVDKKGDALLTVPITEVAYHCGSDLAGEEDGKPYTYYARKKFGDLCTDPRYSPNSESIGVEMQNIEYESGKITDETIMTSAKFGAALLLYFGLGIEGIDTHHGIVGWKDCPRAWVKYPSGYFDFLEVVKFYLDITGKNKFMDFKRIQDFLTK